MSYWQGIAKAVGEISDERFKERMISDERKFAVEQKAEDRKYDQETWEKRFQMETASSQQALREKLFFESGGLGVIPGGSSSGGGRGAVSSERMSWAEFVAAHPEVSDETHAELANYPGALFDLHERLSEYKSGQAENSRAVDPSVVDDYLRSVIPQDPTAEITPEAIMENADRYGISLSSQEAEMMANQRNRSRALPPGQDYLLAVPDPEEARKQRATIESEITGYLQNELMVTRRQIGTFYDSVDGPPKDPEGLSLLKDLEKRRDELTQQLETAEKGFFLPVVQGEVGTMAILNYWESGNRVSPYEMYGAGFVPTFPSNEIAKRAYESGFLPKGRPFRIAGNPTILSN